MKKIIIALALAVCMTVQMLPALAANDGLPTYEEAIGYIELVNDYWIGQNRNHGRAFWDNAAYHTGNMEAYATTGIEAYRAYSEAWANQNGWKGATSDNKAAWNYGYDESANGVLFGDWQICFQTYCDLYNADPADNKIARAREVMEYEMSTDFNGYWWWADGLYMVMPVMTKLYLITGNEQYLNKLYEYYRYAKTVMYDGPDGYAGASDYTYLFHRDGKYIATTHLTDSGKKDFWARGQGWVFAGLSKVLNDVPSDWQYRDYFLNDYVRMAKSIAECQQIEGYWSRSMLDSAYAPGYETSGTAFFTYGFLWGINAGILDEATYLPTVKKAWSYLTTVAIGSNGLVGYVQPIGENARQSLNIGPSNTSNFGVGATLLACCEMSKYVGGLSGDIYPYLKKKLVSDAAVKVGASYMFVDGKLVNLGAPVEEANGAIILPASAAGYLGASADAAFDAAALGRIIYKNGDVVVIGHKSDAFYPCEAAAVDMLGKMLDSGSYPARPAQADRDFSEKIPELLDKSAIRPASVTVSSEPESQNHFGKAFDRDLDTRYSADGAVEIVIDLGEEKSVSMVAISFWKYAARTYNYAIQVSGDGANYETVFSGASKAATRFMDTAIGKTVRYIKVTGSGNSDTDWTNVSEIIVYGDGCTLKANN